MGSKLLLEAFEQFQTASHSLERVHQELSRKVLQLSRRLKEKNRELERNLAEKERIRQFLDTVMAHLTNGVLVLDADGMVALKLNCPADKLTEVIEILPSLNGPTVAGLHNSDWFSVESVVSEKVVRELIPRLIERGAEGIIEFALNKVI